MVVVAKSTRKILTSDSPQLAQLLSNRELGQNNTLRINCVWLVSRRDKMISAVQVQNDGIDKDAQTLHQPLLNRMRHIGRRGDIRYRT